MAVEELAEEVATNLEEIAEVTRRINGKSVGLFVGGLAVGIGVGFYLGHRWNKEKIKAEVFAESEIEVEKIREAYQARNKPDLEEIVEEKGYSQPEKVDYAGMGEAHERPLLAPVPGIREPEAETKVDTWNYGVELDRRSANPGEPYVIHQEEFVNEENGYTHVTYTYYEIDDVMCDEDDEPVPHADLVVGQTNLKFGHGTDDPDVVFVRNERLELEIEICRLEKSYEEEVLGHGNDVDESA